ncbi:MAG: response regulator containing a CheY-like receiver domain and an DNA-binding domain [Flaviaesturariibacter sp.]|nr:response regulator containing a CheY-like receiver domain and an DNA-binding domain [Flaviaesturariibacter sp.]
MQQINVLITDDHQLLLDGIQSLLAEEADIRVSGTALNGYEALAQAEANHYDVCLLDISMPGLDGIATARALKRLHPALAIIVLTTYRDREIVAEMLEIGVSGYLLKNATRTELAEAIRKVSAGGIHFSNEIQEGILDNYVQLTREKNRPGSVILTHREKQILGLLARELTNEKIASELHISYRTVETHRKNLLHKTGSHNLAGLLKHAYRAGLLE